MNSAEPEAPANLTIREDSLEGPEIISLLEQHLTLMSAQSPPESTHALDLESLRAPGVMLWTAWRQGTLLGCGALKQLGPTHGEIKSMHTAASCRGQGVGTAMLRHILNEAHSRGCRQLSLETGSMPEYRLGRSLYKRHGFSYCSPFGDYREDANSVFMTRELLR